MLSEGNSVKQHINLQRTNVKFFQFKASFKNYFTNQGLESTPVKTFKTEFSTWTAENSKKR